jgi:hypothetical protein
MSRLTLSLEAMHQALKEASARLCRSIAKITEEGLILRGIKPVSTVRDLLAKARARSKMTEDQAIQYVDQEIRAERES